MWWTIHGSSSCYRIFTKLLVFTSLICVKELVCPQNTKEEADPFPLAFFFLPCVYQEDCAVQNVWLMGGLSVLTSVPTTPQPVCLLCASKGRYEVIELFPRAGIVCKVWKELLIITVFWDILQFFVHILQFIYPSPHLQNVGFWCSAVPNITFSCSPFVSLFHQMIFCQICCEPFHSFCLSPEERPMKENKENWCCRRCKFCHVCGRRSKSTKVCNPKNKYFPKCRSIG